MEPTEPAKEERFGTGKPLDGSEQRSELSADQLARECEGLRQKVRSLEDDVGRCQVMLTDIYRSEAKYRELVEESCSIVLRMNTQGNVTYANRHALSFFGYTERELLGKNVVGTIVPLIERSGRDLAELIHDICEHPERYQDNENENVQQDGTSKWIAWTNKGIRDASGRPEEILCIGNDITARKRAEETLQEEQQALRRLLESQQHDRKLVAYEIHDSLAQLLSAAILHFEAFDELQRTDAEAAPRAYQTGRDSLDRALAETRRLITDLRPLVLEESGIVEAIAQLIAIRGSHALPRVEFVCDSHFGRLDPLLENALYRIVQEGLNNATRHSGSEKVVISLREHESSILLEIKDWGSGFDVSTVGADRFGLRGIRERARILGGEASIESSLGKGTSVTVRIPGTHDGDAISDEQDELT
ncbi:MAG: PAS domain S-box protein [Pirellulales bacterium]|nr:PAS domain S-box protein [Pirellulales bacterium]